MNKLSFIYGKGNGLPSDMEIIKDYLALNTELEFRFHLKKLQIKNKVASLGFKKGRRAFSDNMTNAICVDTSIKKVPNLAETGNRLLVAANFDYQYRDALRVMRGKASACNKNIYNNYTHVLTGCPFVEKLIKDAYDCSDKTLITGKSFPTAFEICDELEIEKKKKNVAKYYPACMNKKILSIMIYGEEEEDTAFTKNFDMKALLKKLGDDWFVMTNSELIMEKSYVLGDKYKDSFGYVKKLFSAKDVLFFSDVFISNSGRNNAYFTAKKKPVYCLEFSQRPYEEFMKEKYNDLYLSTFDDLMKIDFNKEKMSKAMVDYINEFSYEKVESPLEAIKDIFC